MTSVIMGTERVSTVLLSGFETPPPPVFYSEDLTLETLDDLSIEILDDITITVCTED
jgi:hypothetical protein